MMLPLLMVELVSSDGAAGRPAFFFSRSEPITAEVFRVTAAASGDLPPQNGKERGSTRDPGKHAAPGERDWMGSALLRVAAVFKKLQCVLRCVAFTRR